MILDEKSFGKLNSIIYHLSSESKFFPVPEKLLWKNNKLNWFSLWLKSLIKKTTCINNGETDSCQFDSFLLVKQYK